MPLIIIGHLYFGTKMAIETSTAVQVENKQRVSVALPRRTYTAPPPLLALHFEKLQSEIVSVHAVLSAEGAAVCGFVPLKLIAPPDCRQSTSHTNEADILHI